VEARRDKQAGSALGAVLGRRGCADQDAAGRMLLLTLIRLHALGALTFDLDLGAAVHGDGTVAEPSTVATPPERLRAARGAGCRGGGRVALDGVGTVGRGADLQTPPAYNMGESVCIQGDGE
jgi:hypothetical protein